MYYGLLISSYECRMIWHWQFGSTSVYQIIEIASQAPIWQCRAGMKWDSQKPAGVIMTHFLPSVIIFLLCLGAASCSYLKYIWHIILLYSFYLSSPRNKFFVVAFFVLIFFFYLSPLNIIAAVKKVFLYLKEVILDTCNCNSIQNASNMKKHWF